MTQTPDLLLGEFRRTLDQRYRLAVPEAFLPGLDLGDGECVLAKERVGCLSLWNPVVWLGKVDMWIAMATDKIAKGVHDRSIGEVQRGQRLPIRTTLAPRVSTRAAGECGLKVCQTNT